MKRLIINADDFGLSDGICRGIHELLEAGAVSSTTLMLAAEGAINRCSAWKVREFVGRVGVHLQLTDGRPILPIAEIPGLVDEHTGMFRSKATLPYLDDEEVEREWRAQIELAHELLKAKPSHLDSHHGAHHVPKLAQVFIKLALEFDLPVRDCTAMRTYRSDVRLFGSDVVLYDWTGHGFNSVVLQDKLRETLAHSDHDAIVEVVSHPGYSSAELRNTSRLNDLREEDLASLLSLKHARWLELEGIQLISFSQIR